MSEPTQPPPNPEPGQTFWQRHNIKVVAGLVVALASALGVNVCRCPPAAVAPSPVVTEPPKSKADSPKVDDDTPPTTAGKRRYGLIRSTADPDDRTFSASPTPPANLPPAANLAKPSLPGPFEPAYDQGQLGSCGPNSVSKLVVYDLLKQGVKGVVNPSRLYIYLNTRALMGTVRQDSGVSNKMMLKALAMYGWCNETDWPYNVRRFTSKPPQKCYEVGATRKVTDYYQVRQDLGSMKQCVASGHPFVYGFTVYESFESDHVTRTGDVPMPESGEAVMGGHDVLIVGYDDARQAFLFINSWGPGWGSHGYGTMPYDYATNPGLSGDFWTISTAPAKLRMPDDDRLGIFRLGVKSEPAIPF